MHLLGMKRSVAEKELLDGNWRNTFNKLRFDDLVPNDNQVATFFTDWAAQNHLHLSWRTKLVPQRMSLEAMKVESSPFTEEGAALLS